MIKAPRRGGQSRIKREGALKEASDCCLHSQVLAMSYVLTFMLCIAIPFVCTAQNSLGLRRA